MKRLLEIVNKLKPSEIQFIKERLDGKGRASKKYELFKLLIDDKPTSDKDAANKIYKRKPDSAFSQLKKRLKNDVLNLLMVAPSTKNLYDSAFENEVQCQKLILQGNLLLEKGIRDEAFEILRKAFSVSVTYEFHHLSLMLGKLFYEEAFFSNGYEKNVCDAEECFLEAFDQLKFTYSQQKRCFEGYSPFYPVSEILEKQGINQVGFVLENPSTKTFWFKYAVLRELVSDGEYQKAQRVGIRLKAQIDTKDSLNTRKFKGLINLELGKAALLNFDISESRQNAIKSIDLFKNHVFLWEQANDLLFRSFFNGEKFHDANVLAQKILSVDRIKDNKCLSHKWFYYLAFAYFKMNSLDMALKVLNKIRYNEKEPVEFGINVRVLDLMIALEYKDLDYFDCRLECFRKQLSQCNISAENKQRNVYAILKELSKYNLDFKKASICGGIIYDILNNTHSSYKWTPLDLDVFPFFKYVGTKLNFHQGRLKFDFRVTHIVLK